MRVITASIFYMLIISFFMSCSSVAQKTVEKGGLISSVKLAEILTKDKTIQLVDVRTPNEYKGGTIAHAANINFHAADFKAQISKMDTKKPLYIFCAVGGRSAAATKVAKELGFVTVYDLEKGYTAWSQLKK